jgi:dipeptidyl aminopeptidase/acylaminoacyl peptidase
MNRRSFLLSGGGSLAAPLWRGLAQTSLGTLVWVEAGGIRVRDLPDGRAATLASGTGLHSPRFSPSGAWIAYQKLDRSVLVVRSDGREGASFAGHGSTWLGQEDRLAVRRGADVAVYTPANRWKSPDAFWKDAGVGPFAPGGQQYAAVRVHHRPPDRQGLNQDRSELYVASDDRTVRVLIPKNEGEIRPHSWTRDGRELIYWRADEWSASIWTDGIGLSAIPVAGGPERELGVASLVHADMVDLAPAAAGNKLIVVSGGGRETWARKRLVSIDLDTGEKRNLTPPDMAALGPTWSPDGRTVAYCAAPDAELAEAKSEAGKTMRVLNPDGSVTTKVRTADMRIGIGGGEVAHRFLQLRKIWALDPVGGAPPRQLTADPRYRDEEPLWSADGSHILFARMDYDGHASLWLIESSGSGAREICRLRVYGDSPAEVGWFGFYGYIDWRTAFDWRRAAQN